MKICLVTGGSKGIGLAIAESFLKNGYAVVSTYNNTTPPENGVDYVKCDVRKTKDIEACVKYVLDKYGKIDVLVNNAGISHTSLVQYTEEKDYDEIFDTNMKSVFTFVKLCVSSMLPATYGRIINISSIWGNVGASCESVYSASKGAIISFTKSIAKEFGPSGVTANVISPGAIDTSMLDEYYDEDIREIIENTPVGRLGQPEDIAKAALFLAEADFMTGQVITVDGGLSL